MNRETRSLDTGEWEVVRFPENTVDETNPSASQDADQQAVGELAESPDKESPVGAGPTEGDPAAEGPTEEGSDGESAPHAQPARKSKALRWFRGLTGSLTAGLVLLMLLELGAQALAFVQHAPGPGVAVLLGHVAAAVIAVVAQWLADRGRSWVVLAAGLVVLVDTAAVLLLFWW
jgi:hypothetical protein